LVEQCVIFDLETVPDVSAARVLMNPGAAVDDASVREGLESLYSRADGRAPFIKSVMHRIVCLGALYAYRSSVSEPWSIDRAGAIHIGQRTERELISTFIDSLGAAPAPQLVGFNSSSFDLPVLRYRALALGVPSFILHRGNGRDYWYRYGRDHLDICDFISSYGAATRPSLAELGAICGMSVKSDGMDGSQVERLVEEGRLDEVASYCESDVTVTYLLFLRLSLIIGDLSLDAYGRSLSAVRAFIEERTEKRPHLKRFIGMTEQALSREVELPIRP